jgi:hypothetical protein
MRQILVVIENSETPHSQKFAWQVKAVENVYYALLFSSQIEYTDRPSVWQSWISMGFEPYVKEPPTESAAKDRLELSARCKGRRVEIRASGPGEILAKLGALLRAVAPMAPDGSTDPRRSSPVMDLAEIDEGLLGPVRAAMAQSASTPRDVAEVEHMMRRCLRALGDDGIVRLDTTVCERPQV